MGVMRIGHVSLRVLDIEEAREHYEGVLGLTVTHEGETEIYLKGWDEWDKYSVILTESDRAGMDHVAYKVEQEDDLNVLKERIEGYGIEVEDLAAGQLYSCGRVLRFKLPSGHVMCLYANKELVGKAVGSRNPDPWPDGLVGIGVHWLDHVLLVCEVDPGRGVNKVAEACEFMKDVLEFRLCEQGLVGPNGDVQVAAFMARTHTPHDIAFVAGEKAGIHHCSFFLDEWSDVLRAADIVAKRRVKVDVTPQRHGITRGHTIYFFDPSGNRNETFAGLGYLSQPDMPTITWTEEEMERGIFFHTGIVPERFSSVFTDGA